MVFLLNVFVRGSKIFIGGLARETTSGNCLLLFATIPLVSSVFTGFEPYKFLIIIEREKFSRFFRRDFSWNKFFSLFLRQRKCALLYIGLIF